MVAIQSPTNRETGIEFMGDTGIRTTEISERYFMVSSDAHFQQPPGIWEERVANRFRHRVPRQEVDDDGKRWLVVDGLKPWRVHDFKMEGEDLERLDAGKRTVEERIRDETRDGVDAEIVFPNGTGLFIWATPDPELATEMCRVYNDWAWELMGAFPNRCIPMACIAPANIDTAILEVQRTAKMGFKGINIPVRPFHESTGAKSTQVGYNSPEFEPLWAAIEETGLPLTCHVATGKDPRQASGNGGAVINYVTHAMTPAIEPFTHFCASGILERHPGLRFGTIESGCGFVPWMIMGMDEAYNKHHMWARPKLEMMPSEYFRRQCFASFQEDPAGLLMAPAFGITKNVLWGNDFPHHEGSWPHSIEAIARTMGHLTEEERRNILGLNAARLFNIEVPEKYGYGV